jgi:membrane protein
MGGRSIVKAAKRYGSESRFDAAAALTYFSVLSLFPAILVGTSLIGLLSRGATDALLEAVASFAPSDSMAIIEDAVAQLQTNPRAASFTALLGLIAAVWAASNYVAAFSRALNEVYGTGETRRWWTVLIVRIVLTGVVGVLAATCAVVLATGGTLVRAVGEVLGFGGTAATVWQWLKWPVALVLVMVIVALLYWLAPAKRTRFSERAPGAVLAVVLWVLASAGFGLYVANFGNYDRTYGTLGGVIVFLVWLWITNAVLLFGSEYNATADPATGTAGTTEGEAGEPSAGDGEADEDKAAEGAEEPPGGGEATAEQPSAGRRRGRRGGRR